MQTIVSIIICVLMTIAVVFWVFNNDNGLNDAVNQGGQTVHYKLSNFDYNGLLEPGGNNHDSDWVTAE